MATDVEWHIGSPTRGRVRVSDFRTGRADLDQQITRLVVDAARRSTHRLEEVAKDNYPSLHGIRAYVNRSSRSVFSGIAISDPEFFFHEWDTRPHWPPFGKHSKLASWAREHGMDARAAFFIARKMAPEGATNAVMGPYLWTTRNGKTIERTHRMTVSGLGGYESQQRPPRQVATSGKYALTDALEAEALLLADEITEIVMGLFESVLGEGDRGL